MFCHRRKTNIYYFKYHKLFVDMSKKVVIKVSDRFTDNFRQFISQIYRRKKIINELHPDIKKYHLRWQNQPSLIKYIDPQ